MFYYEGPGNITVENISFPDYFALASNPRAVFLLNVVATCQPDDDRIRTVNIDGVLLSLPNNMEQGSKFNSVAVFYEGTLYRTNDIQVSNVNGYNYENPSYIPLMILGTFRDKALLTDVKFSNSSSIMSLVGVLLIGNTQIKN